MRFRLACALLAIEFAVPGVALYALGYSAAMLGTDLVLARARSVVSVAVPLLQKVKKDMKSKKGQAMYS